MLLSVRCCMSMWGVKVWGQASGGISWSLRRHRKRQIRSHTSCGWLRKVRHGLLIFHQVQPMNGRVSTRNQRQKRTTLSDIVNIIPWPWRFRFNNCGFRIVRFCCLLSPFEPFRTQSRMTTVCWWRSICCSSFDDSLTRFARVVGARLRSVGFGRGRSRLGGPRYHCVRICVV